MRRITIIRHGVRPLGEAWTSWQVPPLLLLNDDYRNQVIGSSGEDEAARLVKFEARQKIADRAAAYRTPVTDETLRRSLP